MTETKRDEFENDPGWDTMDQDEDEEFSDDEFRAYQAQRQREIEGLINQGQVPPGYPYFGNVPPGAMPYELPHQGGAYGQGGVPGSIPGQPAFRQDPAAPNGKATISTASSSSTVSRTTTAIPGPASTISRPTSTTSTTIPRTASSAATVPTTATTNGSTLGSTSKAST